MRILWVCFDHLYGCLIRMVMSTPGGGTSSGSRLGSGAEIIKERIHKFVTSDGR